MRTAYVGPCIAILRDFFGDARNSLWRVNQANEFLFSGFAGEPEEAESEISIFCPLRPVLGILSAKMAARGPRAGEFIRRALGKFAGLRGPAAITSTTDPPTAHKTNTTNVDRLANGRTAGQRYQIQG